MKVLSYEDAKYALLGKVQEIFREMEEESVVSHQEKYSLLEDVLENASDTGELRVAFEQWYNDHSEEVDFEHNIDDIWDMALNDLYE